MYVKGYLLRCSKTYESSLELQMYIIVHVLQRSRYLNSLKNYRYILQGEIPYFGKGGGGVAG